MSAREHAETALANGLSDTGSAEALGLAALGIGYALLDVADAVRSSSRGGSHNSPPGP